MTLAVYDICQEYGSNTLQKKWRSVHQRRWYLETAAALHHFAHGVRAGAGLKEDGVSCVVCRGGGEMASTMSYFSHKIFGKMKNVTCGKVNMGNIIKNFEEEELWPGVEGRRRKEHEMMESQGRGKKEFGENLGLIFPFSY